MWSSNLIKQLNTKPTNPTIAEDNKYKIPNILWDKVIKKAIKKFNILVNKYLINKEKKYINTITISHQT